MATKPLCSVDGCCKPVMGAGLCSMHYSRMRRHGSLDTPVRTYRGVAQIYFEDVAMKYEGDLCLLWPHARTTHGYAIMNIGQSCTTVSRLLCEAVNGAPETPDLEAAHSCGKGHLGCVTKSHLSWKTPAENTHDKYEHGTMLSGENASWAKVTPEIVRKMRAMHPSYTYAEIGEMFGLHYMHVGRIVRREIWTQVT